MSKIPESGYLQREVGELVTQLSRAAQPGSPLHAEITGALAAKLTLELVGAIDRHTAASIGLADQVRWLNAVVGFFTVIGGIAAVIALF